MAALISIGELARRTGLSVSAIRFYETKGLLEAVRTGGNQRRFARADIRRLSFLLIAQQLGLTLAEIQAELAALPQNRAPGLADWAGFGQRMQARLTAQITLLQSTRDRLGGCIGCGCLSLEQCAIFNPADQAGRAGPGPRYLLGDTPPPSRPT